MYAVTTSTSYAGMVVQCNSYTSGEIRAVCELVVLAYRYVCDSDADTYQQRAQCLMDNMKKLTKPCRKLVQKWKKVEDGTRQQV